MQVITHIITIGSFCSCLCLFWSETQQLLQSQTVSIIHRAEIILSEWKSHSLPEGCVSHPLFQADAKSSWLFFSFIYNSRTNSITLNKRDSLVRILVLEQSHLLGEIIDIQNYLTTKNATFPSAFFKEG